MKIKRGKDSINQARVTIDRELRKTPEGRELLLKDVHVEQRLAYYICRELGLICQNIDGGKEDWMTGCHEAPRGRGYCLYHYQKKFQRYVFDDDNNGDNGNGDNLIIKNQVKKSKK